MKYFDSHAHYYDSRFSEETDRGADALLDALLGSTVSGVINVATCPRNYSAVIRQAQQHPGMYTALGIHPTDCYDLDRDIYWYMDELRTLVTDPASRAVAIGEIGLDYHYEDTDRDRQLAFFEAQLELARILDMPVIIHDRDAHGDCFEAVLRHPGVRGVFHSYSGSPEMARELTRHGFMISFSGTVTFKNARRVKEAAAAVPHQSVLIETDCPYLAPVPHRGSINHSGYLEYTCAALAECLGISPDSCAELTADNACRLFGIDR